MQAHKLIRNPVTQTSPGHERRLTLRRPLAGVLAFALFILPSLAAAQPAFGPQAPPSQSELEILRGELRRLAADSARRAADQQAAIDRLNQQIDAERAARVADAEALRAA